MAVLARNSTILFGNATAGPVMLLQLIAQVFGPLQLVKDPGRESIAPAAASHLRVVTERQRRGRRRAGGQGSGNAASAIATNQPSATEYQVLSSSPG